MLIQVLGEAIGQRQWVNVTSDIHVHVRRSLQCKVLGRLNLQRGRKLWKILNYLVVFLKQNTDRTKLNINIPGLHRIYKNIFIFPVILDQHVIQTYLFICLSFYTTLRTVECLTL